MPSVVFAGATPLSLPTQDNGVVERGNRNLADMLCSMLLGRDNQDWDLLLQQIMRTIKSSSTMVERTVVVPRK